MRCLWVGLAYKRGKNGEKMGAFDPTSPSGAIIRRITEGIKCDAHGYDNVVEYIPIDSSGNEQSPTFADFENCWDGFWCRVQTFKPNLLFLFGGKAAQYCQKQLGIKTEKYSHVRFGSLALVCCDHPSYVNIYRRKQLDDYIARIQLLCTEVGG